MLGEPVVVVGAPVVTVVVVGPQVLVADPDEKQPVEMLLPTCVASQVPQGCWQLQLGMMWFPESMQMPGFADQ